MQWTIYSNFHFYLPWASSSVVWKLPGLKTLLFQTTCLWKHFMVLLQSSPASSKSRPHLVIPKPGTKKNQKPFTQRLMLVVPSHAFQNCKRPGTTPRMGSVCCSSPHVLGQHRGGVWGIKGTKTSHTNNIWENFTFSMLTSQLIPYSTDTAYARSLFSHLTEPQQWDTPSIWPLVAKCWTINLTHSFRWDMGMFKIIELTEEWH